MKRREFLLAAATIPPAPGLLRILRSPKDGEQVESLRKVPSSIAVQAVPRFQRSAQPQTVPGGITGLTLSVANGQATLSWQDGHPPFQIEGKFELDGDWQVIGNLTMARTVTVPANGSQAFYRVRESVPMPLELVQDSEGVHLSWTPPDF